ncbi:DNA replication/repair protein RecF [candidate division WOR-3 bacterium]|nr:DNA replication/repair protein RecF [candidate division WOR-3 bacterium]
MYLEKIVLENFRNYSEKSLSFDKSGSFLCGRNGCGKTNLLESIYILSYGKSFRTMNLDELVMLSKDFFRIKGSFNGAVEKKIEFRCSVDKKKIFINGVEISNLKELIGTIALIFLSLNDINLISGEPSLRRRFLDSLLSLLFPDYLADLLDYRRVLRQRNKILYLRKIGRRDSTAGIEGWTEELIQIGSRIIKKRLSIMKDLNKCVSFYYTLFSPEKDKLSVGYSPSFQFNENIDESFNDSIRKRRDEELEKGMTLTGPHRDDLLITINELPMRKFASEGEQRTCAISLKIAKASFLKNKRKDDPILLIDEAVAELDIIRTEKVLNSITEIGQCFIATTKCEMLRNMTSLKKIDIENEKGK